MATGASADGAEPVPPPETSSAQTPVQSTTSSDNASAAPQSSETPGTTGETGDRRPSRAILPGLVAIGPGLLFHGLGPLAAGDPAGAKKVFALEGAGLGAMAFGLGAIGLTGASRRVIGPLYATTLGGFGLFSFSALSNLYSVFTLAVDPGIPITTLPKLELELGYQAVIDPRLDHGHQLALDLTGRHGPLRLGLSTRLAPDGLTPRARLYGAWRVVGPGATPAEPVAGPEEAGIEEGTARIDGSYVELELGSMRSWFGAYGFSATTVEGVLRGRYGLGRLSTRLRGSFAELAAGYAFEVYRYEAHGIDLQTMLLMELAWGVDLGRRGPVRGEASVFYNNRHDDYAGGIQAGIIGYGGLRGRVYLGQRWGVSGEVAAGNAFVARLSALYHFGAVR